MLKTETVGLIKSGSQARLTKPERTVLELIADQECLNISETIRYLIREAGRSRGLWPPKGGTNESQSISQAA